MLDLSLDHARALDGADPLAPLRERFFIPPDTIYLDGNSLGLLSRDAEAALVKATNQWRQLGVRGWTAAEPPWFYFAERLGARVASLVGAEPDEVVLTGTTTVNIHALVSTFFQPQGRRRKILADELDFPTDIYALKDQLRLKGCDPEADLVRVPSGDGRTLDEREIVQRMNGDVALVFLPSALYRSGQLLDMELLTREAHQRGIVIGFDCAHSVGAVPHHLDAWGVDFAVWCSYKYLGAGPGSSAFIYVNQRHFQREPCITGWFGSVKERQFDMSHDFVPAPSAGRWQISSPGIIGSAALEGALELMLEAGIERIRAKSLALTSYLIELVDARLVPSPYGFRVGSPRQPGRRTGHVALERDRDAPAISAALRGRGVVADFRAPNVVRVAPVALYNTFSDVWHLVQHLIDIIDGAEYRRYEVEPGMVP